MLDALKFVQGAVSRRSDTPALTHFHIANHRVTGFNGTMAISAPINLDIDCCPTAQRFVKAIAACSDTTQLHLTPTGKLSVRSGKFKALIDTLPASVFPMTVPEGQQVGIDGKLLPTLRLLYPFTVENPSPSTMYANGVLLNGDSAYATNNLTLIEVWLGYNFPNSICIPRASIKELIRINEEPTAMLVDKNSVTFFFSDDRWLRTQLIATPPPVYSAVLDRVAVWPEVARPLPADLFTALATLAPFVGDLERVQFDGTGLTTIDKEGGIGAAVDLADLPDSGCYNLKNLQLLDGVAKSIDFTQYPNPAPFYGEGLRGCVVGSRA
jgi:hypothetical protein